MTARCLSACLPSLLTEGAELPETFSGASERWLEAAAAGERLTIRVPAGEEKMLAAEIVMDEAHPDYAGTFRICLGKGAKLRLLWKISAGKKKARRRWPAPMNWKKGQSSMCLPWSGA